MGKKLSVQWADAEEALELPVHKMKSRRKGLVGALHRGIYEPDTYTRYMQQDSALQSTTLYLTGV